MGIEHNFTTFTELDPNSDIALAASSLTITSMREDAGAYVRKYDASGWGSELEFHLDLVPRTATSGAEATFFGLSTTATWKDDGVPTEGLWLTTGRDASGDYRLYMYTDNGTSDNILVNVSSTYRIKIYRKSGRFYAYVFLSSDFVEFRGSLSCSCSDTTYNYLYACGSNGGAGTGEVTFDVDNLDEFTYTSDKTHEMPMSFYEADPDGKIDISSSFDFNGNGLMYTGNSYLMRDYNSHTFTNFTHNLKSKLNPLNSTSGGFGGIWGISNQAVGTDTLFDSNNDGIGLYWTKGAAPSTETLTIKDYTNDNTDSTAANLLIDTWYYLSVVRSGTTITVYIYTDELRTSLEDTLSITCGTDEYRYFYALYNKGAGAGAATASPNSRLYELEDVSYRYADFGEYTRYMDPAGDDDGDLYINKRYINLGEHEATNRGRRDGTFYVRKDLGVGNVGDFEYEFSVATGEPERYASIVVFGLTNTSTTHQECMDNNEGILFYCYDNRGAGHFYWTLSDHDGGSSGWDDSGYLTLNTTIWVTVARVGTAISATIYNNPRKDAGDIVHSFSFTGVSTTFRYLYSMMAREGATYGDREGGHVVYDFYDANAVFAVAPSILGGYVFAYNRNNSMLYTPVGTSYRQLQISDGATIATTQSVGVTTESCAMVDSNTLFCGCEESTGTHGLRKYAIDNNWVDTTEEEIDINIANDNKKHVFAGDPMGYLNEQM